ncbi:MAG TPA: CBS domain-containing protein [Phycisphaerae bacterium]|nr:CBS domain-containing protein [Phycisphaerae bacterium]
MATVADVLASKGARVVCIGPEVMVLEATQKMNGHRIGALVVTSEGAGRGGCDRVVGMFTERDVLSRVVAAQRDPAATRVSEVMTGEVAFVRPETDLDEVGAIMKERRVRHLPVCEGEGELRGLISQGDVNAWHIDGQAAAIEYLHDYIHGRG